MHTDVSIYDPFSSVYLVELNRRFALNVMTTSASAESIAGSLELASLRLKSILEHCGSICLWQDCFPFAFGMYTWRAGFDLKGEPIIHQLITSGCRSFHYYFVNSWRVSTCIRCVTWTLARMLAPATALATGKQVCLFYSYVHGREKILCLGFWQSDWLCASQWRSIGLPASVPFAKAVTSNLSLSEIITKLGNSPDHVSALSGWSLPYPAGDKFPFRLAGIRFLGHPAHTGEFSRPCSLLQIRAHWFITFHVWDASEEVSPLLRGQRVSSIRFIRPNSNDS